MPLITKDPVIVGDNSPEAVSNPSRCSVKRVPVAALNGVPVLLMEGKLMVPDTTEELAPVHENETMTAADRDVVSEAIAEPKTMFFKIFIGVFKI